MLDRSLPSQSESPHHAVWRCWQPMHIGVRCQGSNRHLSRWCLVKVHVRDDLHSALKVDDVQAMKACLVLSTNALKVSSLRAITLEFETCSAEAKVSDNSVASRSCIKVRIEEVIYRTSNTKRRDRRTKSRGATSLDTARSWHGICHLNFACL